MKNSDKDRKFYQTLIAKIAVDIEGELVQPYETDEAYHFYDGNTKCWLPKDHCEWDGGEESNIGTMTMPMWLAEDKGLV